MYGPNHKEEYDHSQVIPGLPLLKAPGSTGFTDKKNTLNLFWRRIKEGSTVINCTNKFYLHKAL